MITLYQAAGAWGLSSVSPFCTKLETWLRMAGIPYEVRAANPLRSPKGKIPFIEHEGKWMGDSQLIVEHLTRTHDVKLDDHLSAEERARGHATRRMLEDGLYFVLVHDRWLVESGWALYRPVFLEKILPPVIGRPIVAMIRRQVRESLRRQGTGRHTPAEIDSMGVADVEALAVLLGDRPFFLGEQPSSVDASVYAFVAGILAFPGPSAAKAATGSHANLVAYRKRMEDRYWPTQG